MTDIRHAGDVDPRTPDTPDEWQFAADLAHTWLAVDAARHMGIIAGGPEVNRAQCEELLRQAAEHGIEPAADAVQQCMPLILLQGRI